MLCTVECTLHTLGILGITTVMPVHELLRANLMRHKSVQLAKKSTEGGEINKSQFLSLWRPIGNLLWKYGKFAAMIRYPRSFDLFTEKKRYKMMNFLRCESFRNKAGAVSIFFTIKIITINESGVVNAFVPIQTTTWRNSYLARNSNTILKHLGCV